MEGGAVRNLGAADRSEGESGVGVKSGECEGQGIHFGERGKRCEGIGGSEPVEAGERGDLGPDGCYKILCMLLAAASSRIGVAYRLRELCKIIAVHRAPGVLCHHHDIGYSAFRNIVKEL